MPRIRVENKSWHIIQGDARQTGLPDAHFHCVATSPPYFGLREYGDDDREIGDEKTPDEYVEEMRKVGREVWRVLRDDGTWFLNLGDSFASSTKGGGASSHASSGLKKDGRLESSRRIANERDYAQRFAGNAHNVDCGIPSKSLLMIPQRVALALQADGWIVRAQIPWIKTNCMPESVRDRPTVAHEYVFLLAKSQRYFWDADAVRMPVSQTPGAQSWRRIWDVSKIKKSSELKDAGIGGGNNGQRDPNATGRNLRTSDFFHAGLDAIGEFAEHVAYVREHGGLMLSPDGEPLAFLVNTGGNKLAHFAMWPPRLVAPMIKASTSEKGCCPKCGAQWRRFVEKTGSNWNTRKLRGVPIRYGTNTSKGTALNCKGTALNCMGNSISTTLGFSPSCECNAGDPIPCRVLDPFAGSGTTMQVCEALGRDSWGVELMAENIPIIRERLKEKLDPQTMKRIKS